VRLAADPGGAGAGKGALADSEQPHTAETKLEIRNAESWGERFRFG
jgi:hypothetical protein